MRRLITTALLAGAVGLLPNPTPADATTTAVGCLEEAIDSCDDDFGGGSFYIVAIRGYCYMIRAGWCAAFDS